MIQKQKPVYSRFLGREKLSLGTQRAIGRQPKKKKTKLVESIEMETKTKTKLSFIIPCLLIQVSLKLRPLRKTNVIEAIEGAI